MKSTIFNNELELIKNDRLRRSCEVLLNELPDYFYEIPASSTGKYHPKFALGEGGLVRHTKVAVRIAYEIIKTQSIGNVFTDDEKDLILISLMLHDGLKEGFPKEKYTKFDHPILAANFVNDKANLTELTSEEVKLISTNISSHMGEWNKSDYSDITLPLPKNKYQKMVHMCDLLASRKFINVEFDGNDIIM
ncbi:MAG: hypothetical protein SOZ95_00615 [Bacilli bacterium]|nr:hypothetical protein [Bacilli bacterium]MDY3800534.1 hypothetical protein [Bacilli bacterium]